MAYGALLGRAEGVLGQAVCGLALRYAGQLAALDGARSVSAAHVAEGLQYAARGGLDEALGQARAEHAEHCLAMGIDADDRRNLPTMIERLTWLIEQEDK